MPRPLSEQVIVLTGASSGIGRATTQALARRHATLVLAARNEAALQETVRDVELYGGKAIAVPTDVSVPEQVQALAEQAAALSGQIDTWINGAAVAVYGTIDQLTPEEMRRIIEVDLLGTMYGSRAALPHLRQSGGTLINISSVAGRRAMPLLGAYSAAKHGVIGFSDALRLELAHEGVDVGVTAILPYGIDTPFFIHARSKLGVLPKPTPPVYQPEDVANAIVWAAEHRAPEIVVGGAAKGMLALQRLSPRLAERMLTVGDMAFRAQLSDRPDDNADNLFAPMDEASYHIHGDFGGTAIPANGHARSVGTSDARRNVAIAGFALVTAALLRRTVRR